MLHIKKLTLTNVGVYKGTREIEFEKGLNIIQATNGKGKSTAIQAIEMLLINEYEGNFVDYINNDSNSMNIILDFSTGTKDYTVTLSCKKNKNGVSTERILFDSTGNKIAEGEECISYMASLYDPSLTKYSLVAKQKPVDNIVTCKDAERMDLFKKIRNINLEKYVKQFIEPQIDVIKNDIINIEKEIYRLETIDYTPKSLLVTKYSELEIITKRNELQDLQKKQQEIENKINEYNSLLKEKESLLQEYNSLQKTYNEKQDTVVQCEFKIKELSSPEYIDNAIKDITNTYNQKELEIKNEIAITQKTIDSIKQELLEYEQSFKKEIETLDTQIGAINILKLPKYDDTIIKETESTIVSKQQEIKYCLSNIKSLETGVCPVCGAECHHKLQEYVNLKKQYELELQELKEKLQLENYKKEDYEKKVKENNENKEYKQELVNKKDILLEKYNSFITVNTNKKESLLTKCTMLENSIKELKNNYDNSIEMTKKNIEILLHKEVSLKQEAESTVIDITKRIDTLVNKINTIETKLKQISLNKENTYEDVITELEKDIKEYDTTIIENEFIKKHNDTLIEQKKENEKVLNSQKEFLKNKKQDLFNYEQAKIILLKDFPNYIIDSSIEDIEKSMNDFINMIYYKSLNISLRSTKTSIKLEYGPENNKLPAYRLSGAESKIVSLSFLHYFNKLVGLNCIILDEPDSAMNIQVANSFYESLLQMNSIYEQMIVVTHNERMRNYLVTNTQANVIEI